MITITDKQNCCGCGACAQACPKQCITMAEDHEGFLYPQVDTGSCIECGLCQKACPELHPASERTPLGVYAAIHTNDEIRLSSSSGGVFTAIAEKVIADGGVVFGAAFKHNWEVEHQYADTIEGIHRFRGSKYVQSTIGNTFAQAQAFLKQGRKVLFTGTPCQIAGLHKFLRKNYHNLLSVEILCHSVPSPKVWRKYLSEISNGATVQTVNFRDKSTGWSKYAYSISVEHSQGTYTEPASGPYMKALTHNLSTRPSCASCTARKGKSGADISLGDCWGIWNVKPEIDDNKGVSIMQAYSYKGAEMLKSLNIQAHQIQLQDVLKYNSGLATPKPLHPKREQFFNSIDQGQAQTLITQSLLPKKESFFIRLKRKIRNL